MNLLINAVSPVTRDLQDRLRKRSSFFNEALQFEPLYVTLSANVSDSGVYTCSAQSQERFFPDDYYDPQSAPSREDIDYGFYEGQGSELQVILTTRNVTVIVEGR